MDAYVCVCMCVCVFVCLCLGSCTYSGDCLLLGSVAPTAVVCGQSLSSGELFLLANDLVKQFAPLSQTLSSLLSGVLPYLNRAKPFFRRFVPFRRFLGLPFKPCNCSS